MEPHKWILMLTPYICMAQAPWRFAVNHQTAKPRQHRSYTQETFHDGKSLKGSNRLPRQAQAFLCHIQIFSVFIAL
jgi:hypothetical protein